jgi:hypothetical protein
MIDVQNGSEIVKEPFAEVVKKLNENRVAWSRPLSPGSASGPCFAVPHSPWSRPFAPRVPPPPRPLCSPASLLLRAGPTSPSRSSSATASGLPGAVPATIGGDSDGDLPVPRWKASAHARVCDDAGRHGPSRLLLDGKHQRPELVLRRSIPSLRSPLSTLRMQPHDYTRMTRGRCGSLRLHRNGLAPSTFRRAGQAAGPAMSAMPR